MKAAAAETIQPIDIQKRISGARVGTIVNISDDGHVLVEFSGNRFGPRKARMTAAVRDKIQSADDAGQSVLLVFENDDPGLPIIVDVLCDSIQTKGEKAPLALQMDETEAVFVDGRQVTFDAKEQIVLRCGKASITLTRAGKILIKGAYLLHRSSGVNRIKGASVQIN
jgi:hypothetical protein